MPAGVFKKGTVELLSLLLLQEGDSYGYQLLQLIKERSEGKLEVQEGSLYPMLYRMAQSGSISYTEETVKTKTGRTRTRIIYHLEPLGRRRLLQLKEEYEEVQAGIRNVFRNSKAIEVGIEDEEEHREIQRASRLLPE